VSAVLGVGAHRETWDRLTFSCGIPVKPDSPSTNLTHPSTVEPKSLFWNFSGAPTGETSFVEIETGAAVTQDELGHRIRCLAGHLAGMGVGVGSRVVLHLYNSIDAIVAHMAIHYLGGITCFVDALVQPKSLDHYLRVTDCKVLLTHADPSAIDPDARSGVQVIAANTIAGLSKSPAPRACPERPHAFDPDQPAFVYFTSGTTSVPKGVVLSMGNFANFVRICDRYWQPVDATSRHLAFVPFSHGFGTVFLVPLTLRTGGRLFIMRAFHPQRVLDAVGQHGITHMYGVPSHYQQMLRMGPAAGVLRGLRMAFCAAAKLEHGLMLEWERQTGVMLCEGYGLIETCCGTIWRVGTPSLGTGHMGPCHDLIDIAILDEHDAPVPAGTTGQIAVRGRSVMKGYLNDPEGTQRVISDGWFKTGDQGHISEDGQLFLTGRIKDIINIAGIKVSPFEVEAVLDQHPAVLQSAVVPSSDALYGEVVKAFVRLRPGQTLSERELIRFAGQRLINFQVPKSVQFVDSFPLTNIGKLDRKRLAGL
jgi:acyl-coenzyme A synthetase/AMP-(fatty) acid ligase